MIHPTYISVDTSDWSESYTLFMNARAEMDEGKVDHAIKNFEKSLVLSPHYKTAFLLGECLVIENRLTEAVVAYAASTTMNRSGVAPAHLAEVWFTLGDLDRAKEMIDLALQRQSHYKRAKAFAKKLEEALANRASG